MHKTIQNQLRNIPTKPGIYLFKGKNGVILYIGKAKILEKRVKSYFQRTEALEPAKQNMVELIKNIETITTNSEYEALLLESNLIKQYKPKYNIRLKDDKNYVYIKIENVNNAPKIITTRKIDDSDSKYFGPYTDGRTVKFTLKLLRKLFPYRDCNEHLFNKKQGCLKYHIGQCVGPCLDAVSSEEYIALIKKAELFLRGERSKLIKSFKTEMKSYSDSKNYEKAAEVRDQIKNLSRIIDKQVVISTKKENQDYISYIKYRDQVIINLFKVREGKIIGRENFTLDNLIKSDDSALLETFIKQYYLHSFDFPREMITQIKLTDSESLSALLEKKFKHRVKIINATRGKKKEIIDLGIQNAKNFLVSKLGPQEDAETKKILQTLKNKFDLPALPRRIEAYDISNIQGTLATGSMVVMTNGKVDKKEYRMFRIKTVKGANDVAMMREVLERRLKNKQWPYPDLIMLDGGKPQLNTIKRLFDNRKINIPLISLAKREEELFTTRSPRPIVLMKDSKALLLLQRLRDEAHRFAITYHKKLRAKKLTS